MLSARMHAPSASRLKQSPARIATWARLWLACIAALIKCAVHLLPPALARRLPVLNLPRVMLARFVARLLLLCALHQATPPSYQRGAHLLRPRAPGMMRAILRAGAQRHLVNDDGAFDLEQIARTCAKPDDAIADMVEALECGFTRRNPILPRGACEHVRDVALCVVHICDSS